MIPTCFIRWTGLLIESHSYLSWRMRVVWTPIRHVKRSSDPSPSRWMRDRVRNPKLTTVFHIQEEPRAYESCQYKISGSPPKSHRGSLSPMTMARASSRMDPVIKLGLQPLIEHIVLAIVTAHAELGYRGSLTRGIRRSRYINVARDETSVRQPSSS
ncbi:hypothetical protein BDW69DRAFT_110101 [Aspergillus filifer]